MTTLNPTMIDSRMNPQLAYAEQNAQQYIQEQAKKRDSDLKSTAQLYGSQLDSMIQQYGGAVFQSQIPEQKAAAVQLVTDYINSFDQASGRRMTPEQKQNLANQIINTPASAEQIGRFSAAMSAYGVQGQPQGGGGGARPQGAVGPAPAPQPAPVQPAPAPTQPQSAPAPQAQIDPFMYGIIKQGQPSMDELKAAALGGFQAQPSYNIYDPATGKVVGSAATQGKAMEMFQNIFSTTPAYQQNVTSFLKSPAAMGLSMKAGSSAGSKQVPLTFPQASKAGKLSDIEVRNIIKAHNAQDSAKIDSMTPEQLAQAYPNSWSKYVAPNMARGTGQKPMSPAALKAYEKRTGDVHFNTKIGIKEGVVNANAMEHGGQELVEHLNRRYPALAEGYNGMAVSASQPGLTPAPADGQSISQPGLASPAQPALSTDPKAQAQIKYQLQQEKAQITKASGSLADWYAKSAKNMNTFINTATDEELVAAGLDKVAGARDLREKRLLGKQELDLARQRMALEMAASANQGKLLSLEIAKMFSPESFKKKDGSFDAESWGKLITTMPVAKDAFNNLAGVQSGGANSQGIVNFAVKQPGFFGRLFGKEATFEAQYPAQSVSQVAGTPAPTQPAYTGAAASLATRYGIK